MLEQLRKAARLVQAWHAICTLYSRAAEEALGEAGAAGEAETDEKNC